MYQTFSVVIVDETEERRTALRRELGSWLSVTGEAATAHEAYAVAKQLSPDAIVVYVDEPLARSLRKIEALAVALPEHPVIALSSSKDREIWRKAVLAGARNVLSLPLRPDELNDTVKALSHHVQNRRLSQNGIQPTGLSHGTVVSVFSPKGGVGKSTIAANLGVCMAAGKQRVLLVDLDLQVGAAAIMLNILPKKGIVDLVQTAGHLDRELLNTFVSTHPSGLEVLAAPLWSQQEEEALTPADIEQALTLLSAHYDYLVLDMPAQLHSTALRALKFSTYILLMTSLEVASIQACKRVLQTIGTMEFAKDKIKVVVNVPNSANSLSSTDVAEVLGYPVFWSVPHDVKVAASSQMGEPVVQAHPGSKAAQAITQLHYTLVGAEPARSKGLGGLLRGFKN